MALYLLRHGETQWNVELRYEGRRNSPLTEKGRDQARRHGKVLGRMLAGVSPTLVSSPAGRTVETLQLACAAAGWDPAQCRLDPDLEELSVGELEGMTRAEIGESDRETAAYSDHDGLYFYAANGESWTDVMARIDRALARIDPTAETVLFLHGVSGRMLRGRILGLDTYATQRLENSPAAFYRIEREGDGMLRQTIVQLPPL